MSTICLYKSTQENTVTLNFNKEIQGLKSNYAQVCLSPVKSFNSFLKDLHSKKKLYLSENVSPFLKETNFIVLECSISKQTDNPVTILTEKQNNIDFNFGLLPIIRRQDPITCDSKIQKPKSSLLKRMFKRNKVRWEKKLKIAKAKKKIFSQNKSGNESQ